jgi:MSHA pilin protein MshD
MFMTKTHQRGFTLIELIIFIVVVGIGVAGILSVFSTSVKSSADPLIRKQTLAIAESLLEEILQKEYCDPDTVDRTTSPPTCGVHAVEASRALYDDVSDYDGYTSANIVDAAGVSAGLTGYSIAAPGVTVAITTISGGGAVVVKMITVPVTGPQGSMSVIGYKGNY